MLKIDMFAITLRPSSLALLVLTAVILTSRPALAQGACSVEDLNGNWQEPVSQVVTQEDTAFVAIGRCLDIVDISDLSAPTLIGRTILPDIIRDVAIGGMKAYVATYRRGLRVVDLSSPSAPREVGALDLGSTTVERVAMTNAGDVLVGPGNVTGEVYLVDASDPATLAVMDTLRVQGSQPLAISTVGDAALVATADSVVAFSAEGSVLKRLGAFVSSAEDFSVVGSVVFVAELIHPDGGRGRLRIIDASDPEAIVDLGTADTAFGYEVGSDSGVAVVGGANGAVEVFDVSDPSDPERLGALDPFLPPITNPASVTVSGATAFVGHVSEGLFLFDLTDPSAPSLAGRYTTGGMSTSISTEMDDRTLDLSVYPNPAMQEATVRVVIGQVTHVTVGVYDLLGRRVLLLHDAPLSSGTHTFNPTIDTLPSGTYLVHADAAGRSTTHTLVRVR